MKKIYIIGMLACFLLALNGCEDELLKKVDFAVYLDEKNTFKVGDEVIFYFENTPDWVTFFFR